MLVLVAAGLLMAPAAMAEPVPPARDGNIAIAEEFCAAREKATVEAYDLFIARHPRHPLARDARAERSRLAAGRPISATHPACPKSR